MTRKFREAIRKYLGAERIQVSYSTRRAQPEVYALGSDNPADRSKDHWRYVGTLAELTREVERDTEFTQTRCEECGWQTATNALDNGLCDTCCDHDTEHEELGPLRTAGDIYET